MNKRTIQISSLEYNLRVFLMYLTLTILLPYGLLKKYYKTLLATIIIGIILLIPFAIVGKIEQLF